jgi:hypothetical protein
MTLSAAQVPRTKRALQAFFFAPLFCLTISGVVFGFAGLWPPPAIGADKRFVALKPVLISEGIYRSYCTDKELEEGVRICVGQELRLNLLFTIAAVAANVPDPMPWDVFENFAWRLTLVGQCNYNWHGIRSLWTQSHGNHRLMFLCRRNTSVWLGLRWS